MGAHSRPAMYSAVAQRMKVSQSELKSRGDISSALFAAALCGKPSRTPEIVSFPL
jgi:hypothetical protein